MTQLTAINNMQKQQQKTTAFTARTKRYYGRDGDGWRREDEVVKVMLMVGGERMRW
jgi:hypothetical protein